MGRHVQQDSLGSPSAVLSQYGTLSAAVSAIGGTAITLVVDKDDTITSNLTVPFNIVLKFNRGNILTIDAADLTVQSPFEAGPWQIFNLINNGDTFLEFFAAKKPDYYIYPEWWGADPDVPGTNDTSDAIQKAIEASGHSGGGLFVPIKLAPLTYRITKTINCSIDTGGIPRGAAIIGSGVNLTKILCDMDTSTDAISFERATQYGLSGCVKDLTIDGQTTKCRRGISVLRWSNLELENVDINNAGTNGLIIDAVISFRANQVRVTAAQGDGAVLGNSTWTGAVNDLGTIASFSRCYFSGCGGWGFRQKYEHDNAAYYSCAFESNSLGGFELWDGRATLIDPYFENNSGYDAHFGSQALGYISRSIVVENPVLHYSAPGGLYFESTNGAVLAAGGLDTLNIKEAVIEGGEANLTYLAYPWTEAAPVRDTFRTLISDTGLDGDISNQVIAGQVIELNCAAVETVTIRIFGTDTSDNAQYEDIVYTAESGTKDTTSTWNSFHGAKVVSGSVSTGVTIRNDGAGTTIATLGAAAVSTGLSILTDQHSINGFIQLTADAASTARITIIGVTPSDSYQVETIQLNGTTDVKTNLRWGRVDILALGELAAARTITLTHNSVVRILDGHPASYRRYRAAKLWNPGNVPNGSSITTTVSIDHSNGPNNWNPKIGDIVKLGYDLKSANVRIDGYVSTSAVGGNPGAITVTLTNNSGGPIDFGENLLTVEVTQAVRA